MIDVNKIMDNISIDEQKFICISDFNEGNKYHIILSRSDKNNKIIEFDFNDTIYNDSDLYTWVMCLTLDLQLLDYIRSIDDYMKEFNYDADAYEEALESYNLLLKEKSQMLKFFTKAELKALHKAAMEW